MRTAREMADASTTVAKLREERYPHFEVIARTLSSDEEVVFTFGASGINNRQGQCTLPGTLAVALTDKKLIYAQKRKILGDFVRTVSLEYISDISSKVGWIAGELIIDSMTEYMDFTVLKSEVESIRNSVAKKVDDYRARKTAPTVQHSVLSPADEIKKYKELLDMGVISQIEFDAKKKQLLGL